MTDLVRRIVKGMECCDEDMKSGAYVCLEWLLVCGYFRVFSEMDLLGL